MSGLHAVRVAAFIRRTLQIDVDMIHGRYGEFQVVVDGATVVDGGGRIAGVLSGEIISEFLSSPEAALEEHSAVERPLVELGLDRVARAALTGRRTTTTATSTPPSSTSCSSSFRWWRAS